VRYGLVAKMMYLEEDNLTELTKIAKYYYWLVVVDKGKSVIPKALQKEEGMLTRLRQEFTMH
jgi:hypothetical protein